MKLRFGNYESHPDFLDAVAWYQSFGRGPLDPVGEQPSGELIFAHAWHCYKEVCGQTDQIDKKADEMLKTAALVMSIVVGIATFLKLPSILPALPALAALLTSIIISTVLRRPAELPVPFGIRAMHDVQTQAKGNADCVKTTIAAAIHCAVTGRVIANRSKSRGLWWATVLLAFGMLLSVLIPFFGL